MRLGSGHICKETASTSYSHHASPSAFKPRGTSVHTRRQNKRQTILQVQSNAGTVAQEQWDRLELMTRKLAVAVSEEDYSLAAQLSSDRQTLAQELPAVSQYTFHQLQQLQNGLETRSLSQQLSAVRALGGTGDKLALPHLLHCLKDSQLSGAAFDAIYAIFMWHPDPEISALMNQACRMIPVKEAAVPLLDRIIQLQPEYYEAWNKRATAHYLAQDFERSIQDCEKTLELQPNHFLAMSGMGLCYVGLEKWDEAVHWFQQSVAVHPHMDQIQTYIRTLKAKGFGV
ncbi:hypothetical protein ABBQ32_001491 [Trebouxia sp. C0010 RCD-2024]